jgi:DNA-binding CsgD family transcriptional regulator
MLLEREDQLAILRRVASDAATQGGKVVLVRGEAGIGKSTLMRAFAAQHAAHGQVYLGTCDDLFIPRALDPFWDIAREVPELRESLDRADRARVLETVLGLLTDPGGPSVCILEDTHWADEATLDAIRYLGRRIGRTTGLLLLTYRDGEVDVEHPLRGVIGDIPVRDVLRIQLEGLSLASVDSMVRASRLDPRAVLKATRGNPLLVEQMGAGVTTGDPSSLGDTVLARLQRLTIEAQEALRTLSVIPEPIPRDEALRIAGVDDARLDECEIRGLLDCTGGWVTFRHALIRETIVRSLTDTDRRARARIILRDLPDDTHPCLIVACAWVADDADRLVRAVPVSARYGAAMGSHVQARDDWRALVPHIDRVEAHERASYLEEWAREESIAGTIERTLQASEMARDLYRGLGDRVGESRVLSQMARYLEYAGRRDEAERRAQEAVDALGAAPDGPALARALEAVTYLRAMVGDVDAVPGLVERILAAGGAGIDPVIRIRSLNHQGMAAHMRAYPTGDAFLDQARAEAAAAGLWYEESRALLNQAWAANENLDVVAGADRAQRAMASAARHELLSMEGSARVQYAKSLELRGDWDEAVDVLSDHPDATPIRQMVALPVLASIDARRGRPTAPATIAEAWQLAHVAREFQRLAPAAIALAEHAWITGSDDVPVDEILAIAAEGRAQGYAWSPGRICFWLWQLGRLATPLPGIAEPYALVMRGEVTRAAAILGARRVPYERALVLAHGDPGERQEALDILDGLGAMAAATRVRQILRARGIVLTRGRGRATRRHAAGLTARQQEVLELLRDGLSDRDIADRLFISPRTAEHHVAAVLDKLDVATREGAVERAMAEGLLAVPA